MTCPYRNNDTCQLAKIILKSELASYPTNDQLCTNCLKYGDPSESTLSPVVARILISTCNDVIASGGLADCTTTRANELLSYIDKVKPCGCIKNRKLLREPKELL